jgi:hypothetical protein
MRVTVNVDCTPEEARQFMGLPDVQPIQEALMKEIQSQMISNMRAIAPESVMAGWSGSPNIEAFQKLFWAPFQSAMEGVAKATSGALPFQKK